MWHMVLLALFVGGAHGSQNTSTQLWSEWVAPAAIVAAPATVSTADALVLGTGDVTVPPNLCFSIIADPDLACPGVVWDQPGCQTAPMEGSVTAPGTLLWAPLRGVICCNQTAVIPIAPQQCAAGVLPFDPDALDVNVEVSVGTISQLYHPHVQAMVASFLDAQSPYMMPVFGGLCGAAYIVYIYMGNAQISGQTGLDALRAAYMGSMLFSGAHGLYHMVGYGIDRYDLLTQAAETAALALCAVCYCKDGAMRTVLGEPRVRCLCTRAAWGGGGYALTGNLGAIFSVAQGALNGMWREPRLDGGTRVANVRMPRP